MSAITTCAPSRAKRRTVAPPMAHQPALDAGRAARYERCLSLESHTSDPT